MAKWALVRVNEIALGLSTNRPSRFPTSAVTVYLSRRYPRFRAVGRVAAVLGVFGLAIAPQSVVQAPCRS